MEMIISIRPEDVDPFGSKFDYETFTPRIAARAVVFDGKKVALIKVSKFDYYMLPGGGIDDDDIEAALDREIMEELGCKITSAQEIGIGEVYFDRWHKKQTDHCFVARKASDERDRALTGFEVEEGHEIVWTSNIAEAIRLIRDARPVNTDAKMVQSRDLAFLEAAKSTLPDTLKKIPGFKNAQQEADFWSTHDFSRS